MPPDATEMSLRDYLAVIARRKWIVVVSVLGVTVVAVLLSALQTPIYSSSSEVLIQPRGQDGLFEDQVINLTERAIQTEIQVLEGQAVRQRVEQTLGLDDEAPEASATAVGQTDVISVSVRDSNASNAATVANTYAQTYIDVRREQSVAELLVASTEVQSAIDAIVQQLDTLEIDDPQRPSLVAQLASFTTTLDQLRVDARLRTGGATIIKQAEVSESPVEPTPLRNATLAGVVGLLIGLGAVFLVDYFDDRIRSVEDIEDVTGRVILAQVPVDPPTSDKPLAITDPDHLSVEAYRGLRTNIQFLALDQKINIIQITSSLPGEGKTTTATNLAVVLARAGSRVALLDADLRRPRVHEVFGLPASPGLTDLLLSGSPKDIVNVVDIRNDHRISVYTVGTIPSNPSEMLSGRRMKKLLAEMGSHYDYVVVDSAPVLPVSDSVAVASFVDAVVVVAHADRVTKTNLAATLERLDRISAPIIGLVLNQTRAARIDAYSYGGYGSVGGVVREPGRIGDDLPDDDDTQETVFSDA